MRMKKYIAMLLMCMGCLPVFGQEKGDTLTAAWVLEHIETPALDLVPRSLRRDMVIYAQAGKAYTPLNALRGECSLQTLTGEYASLQVSEVSNVQIGVLPAGGGDLVALVYTVDGGDSPDSELFMYDSSLKELELSRYFKEPELALFLKPGKRDAALQQLVPFLLVSYHLQDEGGKVSLLCRLNVKGSMSLEDREKIEPYLLRQEIKYNWKGKRFILEK